LHSAAESISLLLDSIFILLLDFTELLLDSIVTLLLEPSEEKDIAEQLLEPSEELLDITELLLKSTEELDEDVSTGSTSLLLLDAALDDDSAELLLDSLVSLSLDIAFELLEPSQSSQADEESPLGRVAKLLSSSPQATSTTVTNPIIRKRIKAINAPPSKHMKYTFKVMISAVLLQKMYSGVLGGYP
jgi:hypothetical protein